MATMKNNSFGWNVEDPEQKQGHAWCEQLKRKKQLSEYIRNLVIADMRKRKAAGGVNIRTSRIGND